MDPVPQDGLRELLKENIELTKENNRLLKAMRRDALIGGVIKFVVWIVLILASFYFSMKFLEPYLGMLQNASGDSTDYSALFEEYKALLGQ